MKQTEDMEKRIRRLEAWDERQYMLNENYEVYEKQGSPVGAATLHYHNFYEIIYVMEGEFSSLAGDRTYLLHRGDFLLINRNVMHKYHYVENKHDSSRRIILWITASMLARLAQEEMELSSCFGTEAARVCHFPIYYEEMLRGYLLRLAMSRVPEQSHLSDPQGVKQVMDRGYLLLFFSYLNILCNSGEYLTEGEEFRSDPLVGRASRYIDIHMEERITLDDLAGQANMSKYHFLRKFKELTGMTVHTYLVHKRLIRACEYIRNGVSVTQAWQSCGFADYTSFLRNFKAVFGVVPGKYTEFYPEAPRRTDSEKAQKRRGGK